MNTLTDSNYFYSEKAIFCTNFHASVTPFMCTVVTGTQFEKACSIYIEVLLSHAKLYIYSELI